MWSRLDDDLLHHDKTDEAARRFGRKRGLVTALGTVAFGLLYSNWKLTDGFLHDDVVDRYGIDADLRAVMVDVRFWERVPNGYRVHDFHELNPTAVAVKTKRAKDRARKQSRAGFRQDGDTEGSSESRETSAWNSAGNREGIPREATSCVPFPAPPLPSKSDPPQRGGDLSAVHPPAVPESPKSTGPAGPDYARPTKVRTTPAEPVGFATLVQVAKGQRREHPTESRGDLLERCKSFCAASGLVYDSTVLHKALDAVEHTDKAPA
jgi:hypothetical protein